MSMWTHVAATFRVDGVASLVPEPDWDDIFGRECPFAAPRETWDAFDDNPGAFMPMGSEGTLHREVWVNPDPSEMARYNVTVFGDLRDYDDIDALSEWFKESCSGIAFLREAGMYVDCENGHQLAIGCRMTMAVTDEDGNPSYEFIEHGR